MRAGSSVDMRGKVFELLISGMLASSTSALPPMPLKVFAQGSLTYNLLYGDLAFACEHGMA